MFKYAGFITLTPEFRGSFEKTPEFLDEFKRHIESEQGTLEDIHAVMGPWDFFFTAKYPDNAVAFRALAKIGKFESIKTETFPLEKIDVFTKALV